VVKLWWVCGELWCLNGRFLGMKIFLCFEVYFWVGVEKQRQLLVAPPFGLGRMRMAWCFSAGYGNQQIPFGDDNQNGNNNGNSRSPLGMTTRKARATVKARARAVPRRRLFVEFEDFDFDELGYG
jgi:hypothetical protein